MTLGPDQWASVWLDAELTRELCAEMLVQIQILDLSAQVLESGVSMWIPMLPKRIPPVRIEIEPLTRSQAMIEATQSDETLTPSDRLAAELAFSDVVRARKIAAA